MTMKKYLFPAALAAVFLISCGTGLEDSLSSPDGNIRILLTSREGNLEYSVSYRGESLILNSELGFTLKDHPAFGLMPRSTTPSSHRSEWEPIWGKQAKIPDNYNQLTVRTESTSSPPLQVNLVLRAYDDGFAFRYEFPEQERLSETVILAENTEFALAGDFGCFALQRRSFSDSYEATYDRREISEIGPSEIIGMPLLIEAGKHWMAITEANLTDYTGMSLGRAEGKPNALVSRLAPYPDEPKILVKTRTPFVTPWRTVLIGPSAGKLIESDLLFNLNPPCALEDVSWIRPGLAIWPWWNNRISNDPKVRGGRPSTAIMKYYTDFAVKHGIPNLVVDAGWYSLEADAWNQPEKEDVLTMEETRAAFYDIRKVLDYGREKGIRVHLWVHLASLRGREEEVLRTYSEWGAAGIKLDNYGGDHQTLVNELHRILKIAARYRLTVDYHGAYKNTGIERTYPHFLSREAVLGLEYSKGRPIPTAEHNVTIPFTRMLAGPMDYTPGAFDLDGAEGFPKHVQTTRAQQIAMLVVYFSPFQMIVDYPAAYEGSPDQFDFVKTVPTTWDRTTFIDGYPGDYIILARKKGDTWYIGCMTDENPREMEFALDFLDPDNRYTVTILRDGDDAGDNPQSVAREIREVTARDRISVKMAASGGQAIRLTPAP